jgi:hypothetical protein
MSKASVIAETSTPLPYFRGPIQTPKSKENGFSEVVCEVNGVRNLMKRKDFAIVYLPQSGVIQAGRHDSKN